mgnify:CR=1 FL=1
MPINQTWPQKHKMPKNATFEQGVKWHKAHQKHCSCTPIPKSLLKKEGHTVKKKGDKFVVVDFEKKLVRV